MCCALRCSHSRLLCALRVCLLLLQLCLLLDHLRSSAFSPFSTGSVHFCIFHNSLSPIFHTLLSPFFLHKLMRFLILSFISLSWWSLLANCRCFCCLWFYPLLLFKLLYANTFRYSYMPEVPLCCVLGFSHFRLFRALRCCLLLLQLCLLFNHLSLSAFSSFSTRFCHFCIVHTSLSPILHTKLSPFFLHKLMHFCIFHTSLSHIFHTSLPPFYLHKLMRFLILSCIFLTWWSLWAKRR